MFHEVTPYNAARIFYESVVDWSTCRTLVRAQPQFMNAPRYDFVMINMSTDGTQVIFAQVRLFFTFTFGKTVMKLALIHPLDARLTNYNRTHTHDKNLRLTRLQARPRNMSTIVSVEAIVRGVLLVPVLDSVPEEFLLFDLIDEDMWMRSKSFEILVDTNT